MDFESAARRAARPLFRFWLKMELVEVEEEGRGRFREDMVLPRCLVELKDSFCLLSSPFKSIREEEETALYLSLILLFVVSLFLALVAGLVTGELKLKPSKLLQVVQRRGLVPGASKEERQGR